MKIILFATLSIVYLIESKEIPKNHTAKDLQTAEHNSDDIRFVGLDVGQLVNDFIDGIGEAIDALGLDTSEYIDRPQFPEGQKRPSFLRGGRETREPTEEEKIGLQKTPTETVATVLKEFPRFDRFYTFVKKLDHIRG